jgi:cytochrome b
MFSRNPIHTIGHNPIGALGIIAMLTLAAGTAVSGILLDSGIAEELVEELHEGMANGLLIVVGIHIAGVLFSSFAHKENLIRPMFSGFKFGQESQSIRRSFWWIGLLLIASLAWFWLVNLKLI